MATLPTWNVTLDNAFLQTWRDIKKDAIDNILLATPITALLKTQGRMITQRGGSFITKTIKYATASANVQAVSKGDVMEAAEVETQTQAAWTWRNLAAKLLRTLLDDQQNSGPLAIKSYVTQRLEEARESLIQQFETDVFRATDTTEAAHKYIQSIPDIVPAIGTVVSGTYGKITRPTTYTSGLPTAGNTWWGPKYRQWTGPREVNMISDMKWLYNTLGAQRSGAYPTAIITDQTTYEMYEEFCLDQSQIVKTANGPMADLGFESIRFKGVDMFYTPNIPTAGFMYMLNLRKISWMYDPQYWFEMTEWKPIPNQFERAAQIICVSNLICEEQRTQGLLYL